MKRNHQIKEKKSPNKRGGKTNEEEKVINVKSTRNKLLNR